MLGAVAWGGTVTYLEHFDHAGAPQLPADSPTRQDPVAMTAFAAFQEVRCDYCHTKDVNLPFYFSLPGANQIMKRDLVQGQRHFEFAPVLAAFQQGKPPSVEQLSRIEEVISQNRMPPAAYLLMHPHAHLNEQQRADILKWVRNQRERYYATPGVAAMFRGEVIQPIPETVQVDWKKAALGRELFFDKHLSGDGTLNCASCHGLNTAGVDHLVTATGIGGQKGPINVPTVYNSVFSIGQFWNGRAQNLAEQAAGPVMNPLEMGSHSWTTVAENLRGEAGYTDQFTAVYGSDQIDEHTITDAIAEYEKTLITPDSRFDLYLKGDASAITAQEKRGYERFKEIGCSGCHSGVAVGGDAYEILGLEGPYFEARHTQLTAADEGRYAFTHNQADKERFKVPNLRNVELTGPWFHDGSVKSLDQAVREMARYETPDHDISDQDVGDIVAFLKTLTGKYDGLPLKDVPADAPLHAPDTAN
ncbi:cytochrome c peroxidase [Gluconobacter morbifer G707]|uniref:Cytochrome c peroxidase n=1 Tax=Gluconobacter morbifer G707 TaxID=1088869 RepID=G6XGI2_9PROT|nr:cytochrome c peroxidase [Gluconobacter morbifer G707]